MSGSIDKTKLGAGDGLRTPTIAHNKLRTPVPSSRRFTARTPSQDNERADIMKQRLQEALESVAAAAAPPPQGEGVPTVKVDQRHERAPIRCKRAQTVAEITPSKKAIAHHLDGLFGANSGGLNKSMTKKSLLGFGSSTVAGRSVHVNDAVIEIKDTEDEQEYERNAGRRVYQQLLLNAWRHRRRDAALLADSSAQLQQQVQQLQMQVNVLQQLRQSEGRRRSEATQDNCQLRADLLKYEEKCQELIKEKDDVLRKQELLENDLTDLKMELAAEQDKMSKMAEDLINEANNVEDANRVNNALKNDGEMLENKIKSLNDTLEREHKKLRNLSCDIVNLENVIHGEMLKNKKSTAALESAQKVISVERNQTVKLKLELSTMESHQCNSAQKIVDLKKRLNVVYEIKRRVLQENCDLKSTVAEMQILLQKEREKPWWRTSGQLMYAFIHNAAYLLLPNLPKNKYYETRGIYATNTTLDDTKNANE